MNKNWYLELYAYRHLLATFEGICSTEVRKTFSILDTSYRLWIFDQEPATRTNG